MSHDKSHEIETAIFHPLEEVLDIESGSTLLPQIERESETVATNEYDNKDREIDGQFQEIYDAAMAAFETQVQEAEMVEGKYKARNSEVAVQFLNTALAAAREKSGMKQHKDKVAVAQNKLVNKPSVVNNTQNNIYGDRNEILKALNKE